MQDNKDMSHAPKVIYQKPLPYNGKSLCHATLEK